MQRIFPVFIIIFITFNIQLRQAYCVEHRKNQQLLNTVATVNGVPITEYDIQQKFLIHSFAGVQGDYILMRDSMLHTLIDEMIVIDFAKEHKINISDEDISSAISSIASENKVTAIHLIKLLDEHGIDNAHFRKHVNGQIIWNEIMRNEIQKLSDDDRRIKKLYMQAPSVHAKIKYNDKIAASEMKTYKLKDNTEFKVAEMIVSIADKKKIDVIIKLVYSGIDFKTIAQKFPNYVILPSTDGIIGWLKLSEMSVEYSSIVKNTKVGSVSAPLIANGQLMFMKIIDIKNAGVITHQANADYLKLSYAQKANEMLMQKQSALYGAVLLNQLRKKSFINIM